MNEEKKNDKYEGDSFKKNFRRFGFISLEKKQTCPRINVKKENTQKQKSQENRKNPPLWVFSYASRFSPNEIFTKRKRSRVGVINYVKGKKQNFIPARFRRDTAIKNHYGEDHGIRWEVFTNKTTVIF